MISLLLPVVGAFAIAGGTAVFLLRWRRRQILSLNWPKLISSEAFTRYCLAFLRLRGAVRVAKAKGADYDAVLRIGRFKFGVLCKRIGTDISSVDIRLSAHVGNRHEMHMVIVSYDDPGRHLASEADELGVTIIRYTALGSVIGFATLPDRIEAAFSSGEFGVAWALARKAAALAPTNIFYMLRLSAIAARRGDAAEALQWAQKAMTINPANPNPHYHIASLYLTEGRFEESEQAALKAVDLSPREPSFLRRVSEVAFRRGDFETARSWACRAIDADPANANSHNFLAGIHLGRGDLDAARRAASRALELNPREPSFLRRMSQVLAREGDIAGAVTWAEKAVEAGPTAAASHLHLATLHLRRNEVASAEQYAQKALALAPQEPGALQLMSRIAHQAQSLAADNGSPTRSIPSTSQAVV